MSEKNWYKSYNRTDNSKLLELQNVVLDLLKTFVEICEKYNLRYFMVGGTMLGAIRCHGFIPWDDDADVGMPRSDYEKFIKIVAYELPEKYTFLNYKINRKYKRYFSRIVDNTVCIYNASNTKEVKENVWIDIFPYDGMPKGKIRQTIHFWRLTAWRLLYYASCFDETVNLNRPDRPKYQQAIINFLSKTKIGHNLNTYKLLKHIEKGLVKYAYDDSDTVVSLFGAYMTREILPKRILGVLSKYRFENLFLYGAEHYDEFLRHYYGDYMKPPKDSEKDKHNIEKIEYIDKKF